MKDSGRCQPAKAGSPKRARLGLGARRLALGLGLLFSLASAGQTAEITTLSPTQNLNPGGIEAWALSTPAYATRLPEGMLLPIWDAWLLRQIAVVSQNQAIAQDPNDPEAPTGAYD